VSLPDIRNQFNFTSGHVGANFYKRGEGNLGAPGQVMTHRDNSAQRSISSGSGEHAGHLIGIQFGAPGGVENLGLQNPNVNTFAPRQLHEAFVGPGGNYHNLESKWAEQLKQGYRIHVTVTDKYHPGENRPYSRSVQWIQTSPKGIAQQFALEFVNFSSPQSRAKTGR
jgi:DNA/RNA non-specific endonuclease